MLRRESLAFERARKAGEVPVRLGLDEGEIGLIVIDDAQGELENLVKPDCKLCFFPPVSGG